MGQKIRRTVTGHDSQAKAVITIDDLAPKDEPRLGEQGRLAMPARRDPG